MDVNYKRINDTDGELTLRFSDYKELTRFLEVTKCRNFVLTIKETIVPAVDERVERRTFPKAGESAHRATRKTALPTRSSPFTTALRAGGMTENTAASLALTPSFAGTSNGTVRFT